MAKAKVTGVPLSKIAADIKMEPKSARAKMRRLTIPAGMLVGDTWSFTAKGVAWAKAQLKRDGRKSAA